MAEFNSSSFLIELDSFGRPPPVHKIMGGATNRDIANKLDLMNMEKQKRMRGELLAPSENGMVQLGSGTVPKREQIQAADAQKWRNDVLSMSRPRPAPLPGHEEAERYERIVAANGGRTTDFGRHSDSDEDTRSSSASNSLPSPPPTLSHLKVSTNHHERRSSDYSSEGSHKSPSPPSQADSYSDYASLYKSQTNSPLLGSAYPSPRPLSPTRQFNDAFKGAARDTVVGSTVSGSTVSGGTIPVVTVNTQQRFAPVAQENKPRQSPLRDKVSPPLSSQGRAPSFGGGASGAPPSFGGGASGAPPSFGGGASYAPRFYGSSLTQQVRLTDKKPPTGRAPAIGPSSDEKRSARWKEISSAIDEDRRLDRLTTQLHRDLVMEKKKSVGLCAHCDRDMFDTEDRYTVQEKTFHARCFTCEVCGRELRDQQFYLSDGRFYCKQDYLNEQTLQKKETLCAGCRQPIQDMILSALGRSYHPSCFCCRDCGRCLDGVPFSLDKDNQVYCLDDYNNRFAPRCATCKKPIAPDAESGETVRIVALQNSYHIDCYACEGCGVSLNDDSDSHCYPLGRHLLCEKCHIHWSRTANSRAPITDL